MPCSHVCKSALILRRDWLQAAAEVSSAPLSISNENGEKSGENGGNPGMVRMENNPVKLRIFRFQWATQTVFHRVPCPKENYFFLYDFHFLSLTFHIKHILLDLLILLQLFLRLTILEYSS